MFPCVKVANVQEIKLTEKRSEKQNVINKNNIILWFSYSLKKKKKNVSKSFIY